MNAGGKVLLSTTGGVFLFATLLPIVPNGPQGPSSLGLPPRRHVIESLETSRRLSGWNREGLLDAKGEVIPLPGMESLPERSPILDKIVHRGIEIDPIDGRVYGLLPIEHWCGNDPIALHLARVDVARVLEYARTDSHCGFVHERGWDAGCFYFYEQSLAAAVEPK